MSILGITGKTKILGVMGWPVEHSLSPPMHNAALRKLELDCVYVAFPVDPERLEAALRGLAGLGILGVNITIPHKQKALELVDQLSDEARRIKAVNTVHFKDGVLVGHNTDAHGFKRALEVAGCPIAGKSLAIIGTGGVGRAMAYGAARAGARKILLFNRTIKKAQKLALELIRDFPGIDVLGASLETEGIVKQLRAADIVANATSIGMKQEDGAPLPLDWIGERAFVFDTVYNRPTLLLEHSKARGCQVLDGATMLAYQGAAALEIWTGQTPDAELMVAVLNQLLKKSM